MDNQLKVNCQKERLRDVRVFVEKHLKKHGVPEVEVGKMVLAVDEVCANLMIHSHKCDPQKHIGIKINVKHGKEVVFDISDYGVGFNFCHYKEPSIDDIIKQKKKGGVGLILVKRIMDHMEFIRKHNRNVYRLVKRLQAA
ncbi:MAG: ATP-binding protein [Cyclobacteriaceae bacterium]|nr:ATP-binding protein [Cyclobacteriaceae bacterium]